MVVIGGTVEINGKNSKNYISIGANTISGDLATASIDTLKTSGGSDDMLVDGSVSPVEFEILPGPINITAITNVRFLLVADKLALTGNSFGPVSSLLNGVSLEAQAQGIAANLLNFKIIEDFYRLTPITMLNMDRFGLEEFILASFSFDEPLQLETVNGDFLKVVIQDDLSGPGFQHFSCTVSSNEIAVNP